MGIGVFCFLQITTTLCRNTCSRLFSASWDHLLWVSSRRTPSVKDFPDEKWGIGPRGAGNLRLLALLITDRSLNFDMSSSILRSVTYSKERYLVAFLYRQCERTTASWLEMINASAAEKIEDRVEISAGQAFLRPMKKWGNGPTNPHPYRLLALLLVFRALPVRTWAPCYWASSVAAEFSPGALRGT